MRLSENNRLFTAIIAAREAGKAIMNIYIGEFDVSLKADESPITEADRQAHNIIAEMLKETQMQVLSEEGKEFPFDERKNLDHYWLIDPLDGTKEFVSRNGEFTVNIALIEKNTPILGVVFAPVPDVLYFASRETGAFKLNSFSVVATNATFEEMIKQCLPLPIKKEDRNFTIIASRSHMNSETADYIKKIEEKHGDTKLISAGSSLKLCMVAENKADVYPRFGTTMEWDIAAGHAIVKYSGGKVMQAGKNEELMYNKPDLRNPFFVATRE